MWDTLLKKGDIIDQEALSRGSSIYMPDHKIPMLPSSLAEDLCSLRAGQLRPAISILVNLNRSYEINDYEITPSFIKVEQQLTYYDVNIIADDNKDIIAPSKHRRKIPPKKDVRRRYSDNAAGYPYLDRLLMVRSASTGLTEKAPGECWSQK